MAATITYTDIVQGASISQLAELFGMDRRTVADRIRGMTASGTRGGHPVYLIADAAPRLINNTDVPEENKTRRNAEREKDHWDAQLKKQKFEENAGDLWRTDRVIEVFADVFKLFRESVVVFMDNLEHESGLPPEVIVKTKIFGDGLLSGCREKLINLQTEPELPPVEDDFSDLGLD